MTAILKKKNIFFFLIYFLLGLYITNHYGVSSDEYSSRIKGFVTLKFIGDKVAPELTSKYKEDKNIPELVDYQQNIYGVIFEAPASFLEVLFKIEDKKNQFLLRHYLIFFIFFIALIFFYRIIKFRLKNSNFALLGVLFLILSPRIFANSFYNNKDIVFLSIFLIASFYAIKFLSNQNIKNLFKFCFFTALAVDIRILGILLLATTLLIYNYKNFIQKNFIKNFYWNFIIIVVVSIFIFIFWPYLWIDPINNFLKAFLGMANFSYVVANLFFGERILGNDVPWHYLISWISITTPIIYLFFFIIGFFYVVKKFVLTIPHIYKKELFCDIFFILTLSIPIVAVVIFNSTLYNGWRQAYFIYPSLIYISIIGLSKIYADLKKFIFKVILIIIVFLNLSLIFIWTYKNHPYQYVFFNNLISKKNINERFDLDYWGLSYKNSLEKILELEKKDKIYIMNISENNLFHPMFSLTEDQRSRFVIVEDLEKADYITTNYFNENENLNNKLKDMKFEIFHQIKIDQESINTVYKNISNIN
tara:strand:- start:2055 stop:3650 length:1596 start_codon:yes stop_codon:yes gene_type:complete